MDSAEVGERDVTGGEQALVDRTEFGHPPIVGARCAVGEVEVDRLAIGWVFPLEESGVVERVEQQLAVDTDVVEDARTILGDERTGGREVLPIHDVGGFVCEEFFTAMPFGEPLEDCGEIVGSQRLTGTGVTGLHEFVCVLRDDEAVADVGVGVVAEPVGRLHDVCVSVVDPAAVDVGHPTVSRLAVADPAAGGIAFVTAA